MPQRGRFSVVPIGYLPEIVCADYVYIAKRSIGITAETFDEHLLPCVANVGGHSLKDEKP